MRSYGFKVVSSDPADDKGIPIAVAGQTMIDVQKLLTDIGCMLLRIDLRIQNEIPAPLVKKFDLNLGGTGKGGLSTGPSEGNDAALEYAMRVLCATLDFLGKGAVGTWMTDTFEDDDARAMIAQDLVDLADHLEGYILEYGTVDDVRRFEGLEREKILVYTKNDLPVSGAVGVIVRDEVRRNHWNLTNDRFVVPVSFDKNIVVSDIPRFASSGPVIVIGKVNRNKEGHITSVERIHGCYSIPHLKFQRIVTKDSDRDLLNPLIAITGYDSERDVWTMTNEELGISISKPSWDECVVAFHEYAMFLFETYVDSGGQFEGEEGEIRDFLLSLLPA